MISDIVTSADCAAPPRVVWQSLLHAGHYDERVRTVELEHAALRTRSLSPGVGLRGTARWKDVPYRVTAHVLPLDQGSRLLVTAMETGRTPVPALRRRLSRRLAAKDLRALVDAAHQSACGDAREPAA